jgi:DNA-binding MarR family transcriptional regulator/GNAT superfamily N-acetyltransferase
MQADLVVRVRHFNRTVTQRMGALEDEFLSRGRPLGQARMLWEIGATGGDVRSLRARLDLDSGYVSRLLRALEADGLVTVGSDPADGRRRTARLTPAGLAERAELDRRADELAGAVLRPLSDDQRRRLVTAMADVERLLVASMVDIAPVDPDAAPARTCLREYFAELARRFTNGFDDTGAPYDADAFRPPSGVMLLATLHADPVGCGSLTLRPDRSALVRRVWVAPAVRGVGLGRRLLGALETYAAHHGVRTARLETNRVLAEAIALYRSSGYREVPRFSDEPYAHHWFEKDLPADAAGPGGSPGAAETVG